MDTNENTNYLNNEEKDLIDSLASIDTKNIPDPDEATQDMFKEAAMNYSIQDAKMNIRINSFELEKIKQQARSEGLKYQAFVKSILHKYITGQLVEKNS